MTCDFSRWVRFVEMPFFARGACQARIAGLDRGRRPVPRAGWPPYPDGEGMRNDAERCGIFRQMPTRLDRTDAAARRPRLLKQPWFQGWTGRDLLMVDGGEGAKSGLV